MESREWLSFLFFSFYNSSYKSETSAESDLPSNRRVFPSNITSPYFFPSHFKKWGLKNENSFDRHSIQNINNLVFKNINNYFLLYATCALHQAEIEIKSNKYHKF